MSAITAMTSPLTIGVLGGGQLAQMLAQAGTSLGLGFHFLDPTADGCAEPYGVYRCAAYDDFAALHKFAASVDVITYENENIPLATLDYLQQLRPVHPNLSVLLYSQDRLHEKNWFSSLGIATNRFMSVQSTADLQQAAHELGLPFVVKTRRYGYDGKGQTMIRTMQDLQQFQFTAAHGYIAESWVAFDREISCIGVRAHEGTVLFYDLTENVHREGILRYSCNRPEDPLAHKAQTQLATLMHAVDYVGVMALELFDCGGALIANEVAPRVHNSGHWTIEGAICSQFENHCRAITQLPLGATTSHGYALMINCITQHFSEQQLASVAEGYWHNYGKTARAGRKLGHITLRQDKPFSADDIIRITTALTNQL